MLHRLTAVTIAAALALLANLISPLPSRAQAPSTVTHLLVSNPTSQPVTMYVTLQAHSAYTEDGCTNDVSDLQMVNMTTGQPQTSSPLTGSGTQGTFVIPATITNTSTYELINTLQNPYAQGGPQQQNCLQGMEITFGYGPSCPITNVVPNGVNGGEPTLNLPGTINGASGGNAGTGEAFDITCVNGANSLIQATITAPSLAVDPQLWTYDISQTIGGGKSYSTSNSWVYVSGQCDDNCSPERPGVFPFGCTQCNRFPDPGPPCGQFCAAANGLAPNKGCLFSRSPNLTQSVTAQFGGTVEVSYTGPAHPPATCPTTQFVKVKQYTVKDYNVRYINVGNKVRAIKTKPYTTKDVTFEWIKYKH